MSHRKNSFLYEFDEVPFDEIPPEPGREIQNSGEGALLIKVNKDIIQDMPRGPSEDREGRTVHQTDRWLGGSRNGHFENQLRKRRFVSSGLGNHNVISIDGFTSIPGYSQSPSPKRQSFTSHRISSARQPPPRPLPRTQSSSPRRRSFDTSFGRPASPRRSFSGSQLQHSKWSPVAQPPRRLSSPGRRPISLGRRLVSPGRRPMSPGRRPVSPGRRPVSPGRRPMSPGRRPVSPGRRPVSPGRRPMSPGRRPMSPGKRPMSLGKRPMLPGRRPMSPVKQPMLLLGPPPVPLPRKSPSPKRVTPAGNMIHPSRTPYVRDQPSSGRQLTKPLHRPPFERLGPPVKKTASSNNIIKRNIAAASAHKNKHPATRSTRSSNLSAISKSSQIKKIASRNPISKAKQKAVTKKSNLSKNLALSTKSSQSSAAAQSNAIADLIQGILAEPDVKDMISTIAKKTVEEPLEKGTEPSTSLQQDAEDILNRANKLLNGNFQDVDPSLQKSRKIPPVKVKHCKPNLYCKDCRLEFPTTMLRDLHYKTEMHCFVNGDWWKFNPKPPKKIPKHRFPKNIFCILCWDIVKCQCFETFDTHIEGKRHKVNKTKYKEIFGKLSHFEWCLWDELSLNFRNNFVPVPSHLRNIMMPEYFYDQRVVQK